jgi:mannose/fructose/N-acetylgalactosamine-specific phosphotransferase system component IIB
MPIVLVRIDDRLIHGQIIVEWVPFVKASGIIIVEDKIEHDRLREQFLEAMKIAVPPNIRVEIYSVASIVERFLRDELPDENIILLFSTLQDFKKSLDLGFRTRELNLGCIHSGDTEILSNITITKKEASDLEEMRNRGIHLDLRAIPGNKRVALENISGFRKLIGH